MLSQSGGKGADGRRLKFFMHPDLDEFRREELGKRFAKVVTEKPKESRSGGFTRRGSHRS